MKRENNNKIKIKITTTNQTIIIKKSTLRKTRHRTYLVLASARLLNKPKKHLKKTTKEMVMEMNYQEDNEDEKMTIESKFYNNSKMKTKR